MNDCPDLDNLFDRLAKRDFTDEDIQTLRQSIGCSQEAKIEIGLKYN